MKTLTIKRLTLVNFKGIKELELTFRPDCTTIEGANGTGKTTVFDAFSWLLFGKDSQGRSDTAFSIKTLGADGKPILGIEHSVEGEFEIDGSAIALKRQYTEVWQKISGTTEQVLKNHATVFYANGVKLSTKREYDAKVADLVPEEVFRLITDPYVFPRMGADQQKAILLSMAGDVADEDVAKGNADFESLLKAVQGLDFEAYSKEIGARKKAAKEQLAVIPSQIETAQKIMPEEQDWAAIETEIAEKEQTLKSLDKQIADGTRLSEIETQRKQGLYEQLQAKMSERAKAAGVLQANAMTDHNQASMELQKMQFDLSNAKASLTRAQQQLSTCDGEIAKINERLLSLRGQYRALADEKNKLADNRQAVMAETLEYPEGSFVCPTCKRTLEAADIARKQDELQKNFNEQKAKRLAEIDAKIKAVDEKIALNIADGKQASQTDLPAKQREREGIAAQIATLETKVSELAKTIEEKRAALPQQPDLEKIINADPAIVAIDKAISQIKAQIDLPAQAEDGADTESLLEGKAMLQDSLKVLYAELAKRGQIDRAKKEIAALEDSELKANQLIADLEQKEAVVFAFQKAKDEELMRRINGLFKVVTFSFLSTKLNGNEKLTCQCCVKGVPYSDVNSAGKINAGLDIINALCQAKGVSAPIFIDNRESVNDIIPTISQVVNLCVTTDPKLTIR